MEKPLKLIIADDHAIVRQGLSLILKKWETTTEILLVKDFYELCQLLKDTKADLLICDINMPGCMSFEMIPQLRKIQEDAKILVFSAYSDDVYALRYLQAGANGFLNKECEEKEIIQAITVILNGGIYLSPHVKMQDLISQKNLSPLELLSNREIEVANLLVQGKGLLEVANALNIKATTVSTYKIRVYDKLGIDTIAELIDLYRQYNLSS